MQAATQSNTDAPTPERLLLRAILFTMKPARRARVLEMIGDTSAENVVRLRAAISTSERNALVDEALKIAGER